VTTEQLLTGVGEALAKRQRLGAIATVDAAGEALLRLGRPPAGSFYLIDRGAFVAVGPAAGTVRVLMYSEVTFNDDDLEDFADLDVGAVQATVRAIGEWSPPIYIAPGSELAVRFEGAVAGSQARVRAVARPLPNL
jgi:hypothetical protein